MPFEPFSIRTSDGREYNVPTLDHVWLPPLGNRIGVVDDKGIVAILTPLHISGITEKHHRAP